MLQIYVSFIVFYMFDYYLLEDAYSGKEVPEKWRKVKNNGRKITLIFVQ